MSGAETCFTDLMSGETMLSGDNPKGPCDAVSPLDSRNFAGAFCITLLMAAFTTVKRIAMERPSLSLKQKQSKGDSLPAAIVARHAIFRLD
jgi:hypothetical protein